MTPYELDLHRVPATDFDARANRHRPTDPSALTAEVCRLATGGLMPNDIAQALRMDPASVRTMLGQEGKS